MEPRIARRSAVPRVPARLVLGAFLLSLLFAVPPTWAESGVFAEAEVFLTPERFSAALYGETSTGSDAADFRATIDTEHGDGDGNVSQAEVDAYEVAARDEFNDQLRFVGTSLVRHIQVNERAPLEVRVTRIDVSDNATGPVSDEGAIVRDVHATLTFPSTTRDRVNVTFAQDFRQAFVGMEWGYATFTGTGDWAIAGDTIVPGGADNPFWTGSGFNVTYDQMGEFSDGFEPLEFTLYNETAAPTDGDKKKDSPLAPIAWVLAAVGVALAALRPRRRD